MAHGVLCRGGMDTPSLDFDPIPDPPAGSLPPSPSRDLEMPPDEVVEFYTAAAQVGSLDAAVRLWLRHRSRLTELGGRCVGSCRDQLLDQLSVVLRTTREAAQRVFDRALAKVDPSTAEAPTEPLPPSAPDGWFVTAVGTIDEVRAGFLDVRVTEREEGLHRLSRAQVTAHLMALLVAAEGRRP